MNQPGTLSALRELNRLATFDRRVSGAARTALCLGLTLFVLVSGAALFLSGEPDGGSLLGGLLERFGLVDGESDRTSEAAATVLDDRSARSTRDRDHAAGGTAETLADGSASESVDGEVSGLFSEGASRAGDNTGLVGLAAPGAGDRERVPAGTLYDLSTGSTLSGARILATAYRGTDDPLNAGYPARYQEVVDVASDGSFRVPIFDPEDPGLLVLLQVDHPSCLPETLVLQRRDVVTPEWRHREIRLRRGLCGRVQVTDGRSPLARVPVRVTPTRDGHALLEREAVWVALRRSERLIVKGEPSVRYTDDAGYLRLPYSEHFYFLESLHPLYVLSHRDPLEDRLREGEILYHVSETPGDALVAQEREPYVLTVLDEERAPISDSEIEVQLDESRVLRTLTDDAGRVVLGLQVGTPVPPDDNARVTVLTPAFFKRGVSFKLPDTRTWIGIPSRPARRLEFRAVARPEENPDDETVPIAPEGVHVDLRGLTLVHRTFDGRVAYQGALPEAGSIVEIRVRGYLPREVAIAPSTRDEPSVNLGEIVFDRGLEKKIVLGGVDRRLLEQATVAVSPVDRPERIQRYPVGGATELNLGGLSPGIYSIGVEGPDLLAHSSTFEVSEADLEASVLVPLEETDEEIVSVRGRIVALDPLQMARLSVTESYFLEGVREPRLTRSYPPAPDGTIGSVRRLSGVVAVHLSVLSHEDDAVDVQLLRDEDSTVFDAGEIRLLRRPSAEITFFVSSLGRLDPPLHVSLKATDGLEAHSRFRSRHRRLYIDNLRQGLYQLSWAVGDGGRETFGFEVRSRQTTELQVARALFAEETIEVRIVDSVGNPLPEAHLSSEDVATRLQPSRPGRLDAFGLEPGVKLARVKTRERSRLTASLGESCLPTRADIEPGGVVPTELTLYRPGAAEATVLDADGIELDGLVRVSWEPKVPSSITYGDPFVVDVVNGRFRGDLFPPLPLRFTFRLEGSETSITRTFSLPEDGDPEDLGVLRFEETRALEGVVLLPDGSPARGVTVGLLEFDRAWRFPMRDPRDWTRVRYKAETDVQGSFSIDELPLDLSRDLVLVAHREGYGDAYEYPLDREIPSHELRLELAAGLELDVGYRDGLVREQFRFSLEYQADPADPDSRVDLGEIPAQLFGLNTFSGIEPGLYRIKWGLRDFYDPIPPLFEEVVVAPGELVGLTLLLDGRELRGKASLNGRLVHSGWMLLSETPHISAGTRVGRIVDGRFLMIDPPRAIEVFGAVIPESKPQALQNIARGEALPARIHGYTASLRSGFLSFGYTAYNLKLKFSDEFLTRYPGARLTFPHYEWRDGRFASYRDSEPITGSIVRFHLLPPGIHTFTVRSERGALLLTRPISLSSGTVQLPNGRTLLPALENEILMK